MPSLELCAFLFRKGITLIRIIGKKKERKKKDLALPCCVDVKWEKRLTYQRNCQVNRNLLCMHNEYYTVP